MGLATDKQLSYASSLGCQVNENMTGAEVHKLIEQALNSKAGNKPMQVAPSPKPVRDDATNNSIVAQVCLKSAVELASAGKIEVKEIALHAQMFQTIIRSLTHSHIDGA